MWETSLHGTTNFQYKASITPSTPFLWSSMSRHSRHGSYNASTMSSSSWMVEKEDGRDTPIGTQVGGSLLGGPHRSPKSQEI